MPECSELSAMLHRLAPRPTHTHLIHLRHVHDPRNPLALRHLRLVFLVTNFLLSAGLFTCVLGYSVPPAVMQAVTEQLPAESGWNVSLKWSV